MIFRVALGRFTHNKAFFSIRDSSGKELTLAALQPWLLLRNRIQGNSGRSRLLRQLQQ